MSDQRLANNIILLIIVFIVGMGVLAGSILQLSSVSYYQGVHPSFVAIYHDNKYYTTTETHGAGTSRIGLSTMNFDPDENNANLPNLQGELRDIQVITDLARYGVPEAYTHILNLGGNPQPDEPYKTYEWSIELANGSAKVYQLDLWLASLEVNTFVKADWNRNIFVSERYNRRYSDSEIWIGLETTNEWGNYFTDPKLKNTYFGIAYMELADFETFEEDPALDVIPRTQWVALDLWDDPVGSMLAKKTLDQVTDEVVGSEVNQFYFKDEYFTRLTMSNVGTYDYNIIDGSYKADSMQHTILVHIFVVGEWIVKPDQDRDVPVPDPSGRTGWFETIKNQISDFVDSFASPLGKVKLAILIFVAVVIFVMVTNPTILLGWYDLAVGISKRRSKE